ncbi:liver-expressed antimicrobial peptide 2 [Phyllopteryx taeniolatus]|uniref:liver-expressed antimicrobial peptide 2 n=1 Tax=Phyllopteryx taeniolatus TaxID=161469 RepID=UPI002AD302E7|nr:liver-expressed antimicrobial peptide 2 [Phyllopteryx taeniolatus]
MQEERGVHVRRLSLCLLLLLLLLLSQQVRASPVQSPCSAHKRLARMSPLWRIMNSKPFGAFCQNNYECATGLCRAGHCSTHQRPPSEPLYD